MANSAYKKVSDQMHHNDQHNGTRPNTGPKPVTHGKKKKEGSMSNCLPRISDHMKRDKHTRNTKGNECKCKDGSSSSSDSDNDARVKRT